MPLLPPQLLSTLLDVAVPAVVMPSKEPPRFKLKFKCGRVRGLTMRVFHPDKSSKRPRERRASGLALPPPAHHAALLLLMLLALLWLARLLRL